MDVQTVGLMKELRFKRNITAANLSKSPMCFHWFHILNNRVNKEKVELEKQEI